MDSNEIKTQLSRYYEVAPPFIERCLAETSQRFSISVQDLLTILNKILSLQLSQKYNLEELSFDVVSDIIFNKLSLNEILSVCSINQTYFKRCRQSDLYWQKYALEKYQITQKPPKYEKWFDLIRNIPKSSPYMFEFRLRIKKDTIFKLGYYLEYTSQLRINRRYELEIRLKPRGYIYHRIDIPPVKKAALLMEGDIIELIVTADINNLPAIYRFDGFKAILESIYPFENSGRVLQILNHTKKACYMLTENALYYINIAGVKKVRIPSPFKFITVDTGRLVCIDLDGVVWMRGPFKLGPYTNKRGFKRISNEKTAKMVEVIANESSFYFYVMALDENYKLWIIGGKRSIENKGEMRLISEYDYNKKIKFKSISRGDTIDSDLAIINDNEIVKITSDRGDYLRPRIFETGFRIPSNYILPKFEPWGKISPERSFFIKTNKIE